MFSLMKHYRQVLTVYTCEIIISFKLTLSWAFKKCGVQGKKKENKALSLYAEYWSRLLWLKYY